jgi:hypothetical protein
MPIEEQSARIERRKSLDKMRSKLVSAESRPSGRPGLMVHQETSAARRFAGVGILSAVLLLVAAANVYSYLERDDLLAKVEPLPEKLGDFEPAKNWKADEKAMFYAYAAFSPSKFDARFGPVPEDKVLDRKKAAKKARELFAKGGLNPIVESELKTLLGVSKAAPTAP